MTFRAVRPWLIMALIFILGGVTGSLLTIGLGPHFTQGPPGAQEMRNRWMTHLSWRLHLTDEQKAKIEPIVWDAEKRIEDAHREDVGRISGIMQAANASIKPILNPDQQAELEKMESERERMFSGPHARAGAWVRPVRWAWGRRSSRPRWTMVCLPALRQSRRRDLSRRSMIVVRRGRETGLIWTELPDSGRRNCLEALLQFR